jgi:hypothetical protein
MSELKDRPVHLGDRDTGKPVCGAPDNERSLRPEPRGRREFPQDTEGITCPKCVEMMTFTREQAEAAFDGAVEKAISEKI